MANGLLLCLGVGSLGLLKEDNYYAFSFALPATTVAVVAFLRLIRILHFGWLAFVPFVVWMAFIGYANAQLFYIAWAGV
jgi:hypothetical protein